MNVNAEAILADARQYEVRERRDPRVESLLDGVRYTDDLMLQVRGSVGMTLEVMRKIDARLKPPEAQRRKELGLLPDRATRVLAGALAERVFRPSHAKEQLEALREVVGVTGLPGGFSAFDQAALRFASSSMARLLGIREAVAWGVRQEIRHRVGGFVEIFEDGSAENVVRALQMESGTTGLGHEVNLVVEAATCEAEAKRALDWYKDAIRAGAERIAIKPTALVPLSNAAIATKRSTGELTTALKEIFDVAMEQLLDDGQTCEISIDSERSDLLNMTRDAVLNAALEFPQVRIKMAAQSYLQDTEGSLIDPLLEASYQRVSDGGTPLGVRLVCGANMLGEEHYASMMGFDGTPLVQERSGTHANMMRIMHRITDPIRDGRFALTLGSMNLITLMHNLIGLAQTGVFASNNGGLVTLSMLRGMTGQEVFRYLKEKYQLKGCEYTPVIPLAEIVELFKYYLRRIEEIAGEGKGGEDRQAANYLGVLCQYGVDSDQWFRTQVEYGYLEAVKRHHATTAYPLEPGIKPNRGEHEPVVEPRSLREFRITPGLNAGAAETLAWTEERIRHCKTRTEDDAPTITLPWVKERRSYKPLSARTRPGLRLANVEYATAEDIDEALKKAREDQAGWGKKSAAERLRVLRKAVSKCRENREALVELLMLNIHKSITESDAEVNEAMDFVNLSVLQAEELLNRGLELTPEGDGTAVVICPKNFPVAIPCAHIIARLIAGYRVIVKPSGGKGEEAILPTWELMKALWAAGVPRDALIFLPCDNEQAGYLTQKAERVGFTGSTDIAKEIHEANPDLDLIAETGGRNVAIIDSSTDLKEAALQIVHSVCHFAGQKCSKLRLVIATEDVDFRKLQEHLTNIMQAMLVDSALVPHVDVTPLSREPKSGEPLHKAMTELLPGERWLLPPKELGNPGIRIMDNPQAFDWQTLQEIFAPIVSITQIKGGIREAIETANSLTGSLTGVLFSRLQANKDFAANHWKTGNLYFNARSTGARADQGFGDGPGDSHRGAHGAKTGTPEFLLMNARAKMSGVPLYEKKRIPTDPHGFSKMVATLETRLHAGEFGGGLKDDIEKIVDAGWSYLYEQLSYFSQKRPAPYQIKGQDDWLESKPIGLVMVRLHPDDSLFEIWGKLFAPLVAGNRVRLSIPPEMASRIDSLNNLLRFNVKKFNSILSVHEESDSEAIKVLESKEIHCVYYSKRANVPEDMFKTAVRRNLYIDCREVTGDGRVDMITQYRQQSYCDVHHIAGDDSFEEMRKVKKAA